MGFYKDKYIEELERELAVLEAQGIPSEHAYKLAGDRAYHNLRERIAIEVDSVRQRRKDGE